MNEDLKILLDAFPSELEDDVKVVFRILKKIKPYISSCKFNIEINNETICIPERIYVNEPNITEEMELTQLQKQILDCFLTRHHNGYVRQERLRNILSRGAVEKWIMPYIMRLLGEYIIEIINDIYINIDVIDVESLKAFINENKYFIKITEARIASYWNEYYKNYINKDEYVGFKVKKYIQKI
jgi:serine/threonine protein kinase